MSATPEFEVDNRDTETTWLRLKNPSDLPDDTPIEVNPAELYINMIENCIEDETVQHRLIKEFKAFHGRLQLETEG